MDILAVHPLGKRAYIVRRRCGYYLESGGEVARLDTDTAHNEILGKIPANEHRKGSEAAGEIEAK